MIDLIAECRSKFMTKRRGNPNWGKPEPLGPLTPPITEFAQIVREFDLQPDQYVHSNRLREWASRNKNSKYVPESLLTCFMHEGCRGGLRRDEIAAMVLMAA
jgi:hypothetical protein